MMKQVWYFLLFAACLCACHKDKHVEQPSEPDVPEPPTEITLELSSSDLVFESFGGEKTFTVTCNSNWTLEGADEWCTTDVSSGNGDGSVTVTVEAYDGLEDRNTNVTVKSGTKTQVLCVTQKYKDALLLSKDKYDVPQEGGTVSVEVRSNLSSVTAAIPAEFQSWIAASPEARAVTTKSYDFTVSANDSAEVRSGYIVFSGASLSDTVYVYQAEKERLVLSERSLGFSSAGETFTVDLRTNVDYEVVIPDSAGWVRQVTTRSLRTDRLSFSVSENSSHSDRATAIVVQALHSTLSDTLLVRQSGKGFLSLSCRSFSVPQEGKTISVEVESNLSYGVSVPSAYQSWITSLPESRSATVKEYRFSIGENEDYTSRQGHIVFSDGACSDTVYVSQSQKDCLSLKRDSVEVPPVEKTFTVELQANVDYEVVIPSDANWIRQITTRSLRTDRLSFSASENTSLSVRKTAIVIRALRSSLSDTLYIRQFPGNYKETQVPGIEFDMIYVEGGTFRMGATEEQGDDACSDEKPVHEVTLSDYYIGKFEVTQGLWKVVMDNDNPSNFQNGDDYPVEKVSWDAIQTFLTKLNQLTGKTYVLPTEAQWEYAARGGRKSEGYKYSGSDDIDGVAWYDDHSAVDGGRSTHPVGTKQANELGIYDMSGNVFEWCSDWFGSYSSDSQTNPTGPETGSSRVLRGGSWYSGGVRGCRVSFRSDRYPSGRNYSLGFRVVLLP